MTPDRRKTGPFLKSKKTIMGFIKHFDDDMPCTIQDDPENKLKEKETIMGAPKGNEFWKLRSKHGRDKIFKTPDILLKACYEYAEWVHENPLIEIVPMKKKVNRDKEVISHEEVPKMRAMTMEGLCIFLDVNTVYFNHFEESLKGKEDEISKDYTKVVTHVREIIRNQKFVGAASGFFNANIIARDLGLSDKKDITVEMDQPLFPDVDY